MDLLPPYSFFCIWLTSLGFMWFITFCTLLTYCSFLECSCRTATTTSIGFSKLWYLWTNPSSGDGGFPAIWRLDCCTFSPIRWPKDWYQYLFSWWLKKPCCSGGNLLNLLSSLKQRDNCVNSSEFLESWRPWMWWDRHAASRKKQQRVAKSTHHAWNGLLKAMVTMLDCFAETPFVDFEPRLRCCRMGRNLRYIWTHLLIRGRVIFATRLYIDVEAMPWCLSLDQCQSHSFWNYIQFWNFPKGCKLYLPLYLSLPTALGLVIVL